MRIRKIASIAAVAGATIVTAIALSSPATAGTRVTDPTPAAATVAPNADVRTYFTGDGVRIHAAADPDSTTLGLGYRSDVATAHCYVNNNGTLFESVTDNTTNVTGWVDSNYLSDDNPGTFPC